jgi:hypothetical protein
LKSLSVPSEWSVIDIDTLNDKNIAGRMVYAKPDLTLTPALLVRAAEELKGVDDKSRWIDLLDSCGKRQDGDLPCYTYHSADTLRFTLKDKKQVLLTIRYPGGC